MKLYFRNSIGIERLMAKCKTVQGVHKKINEFLDEHNFKCYYMRSWNSDDGVMIDVGSHSEFFKIEGISYDDYIKALQNDEPEEEYHQITFDEYLESLQKNRE